MTGTGLDAAARLEIADVLVRYATGIDQRDWELFRMCFTDDCVADYGDIGAWKGVDAITAWMEETHRECGHTLHRITNQTIMTDGDAVTARSYVDATVLGADDQSGVRVSGMYNDGFRLTAAGWRIARRRFTMVHLQLLGGDAGPF